MFSGITQAQGTLARIQAVDSGLRMVVRHDGFRQKVGIGASVAVNGCCLTVVRKQKRAFHFDILRETWNRTCFRYVRPPERVNLEASLKAGDPIGGHFVTGHIDGVGRIVRLEEHGADLLMEIEAPPDFMKWMVLKGSVAVDGVSLTVAKVGRSRFGVWLIPHTLKATTLGWKRMDDRVNLEGDMLAKYARKALGKS